MTYVNGILTTLALVLLIYVAFDLARTRIGRRRHAKTAAEWTARAAQQPSEQATPFSATPLDVAILCKRVTDGDFAALVTLWERLFGRPLDPSRPLDQVANECQVALAAEYGSPP